MNAVFFDFDGTLIDSRADLAETVNHTRRDLGLAELPLETVLGNVGMGAKYLLSHSIPEKADEVDRLWEIFRGHYAEHMLDHCSLYPGVRETLAELHDRGWLMGINTAKPRFATMAILEHFGILRHFGNAVIAAGDCPELKPSPLPVRECAARMNGHRLSSNDWMVGDGWPDLQCATNAGIKSAWCTYGFGELRDSRYTVKIGRFDELLRYLKPED